ncbi:BA14K family protein [Mesorhizobium salmacidum]|uniref:Lectin-like protein BA14k n=1 Tax=Mesorhizobium salmacidum TaxID=3015171 RepID=A0ABU8L7Q2_9HYPH
MNRTFKTAVLSAAVVATTLSTLPAANAGDWRLHGYAGRYAEPWTHEWYVYCSYRYRSFNPRTGTFTGYDGEQYFCIAN